MMKRQEFLKTLGLMSAATVMGADLISCTGKATTEAPVDSTSVAKKNRDGMFFKISLAEWSLNQTLFGKKLDNLDFPAKAKNDFGISAVEYVNQFFFDKAKDQLYLTELKKRCDDNGVTSVLIMVDGEGNIGDLNKTLRDKTVDNHKKWIDAAKFLGCHSVRVNAYGEGTREEVGKAATDGLWLLSDYAKNVGLNVIVENHGSYSSDGQWLAKVISDTGMSNCGTLPDFGNFCVKHDGKNCVEEYDKYKGVAEMMPFAKGVSAKSHRFDAGGNCLETDYDKMLKIVKDAGYTGYIGIEYADGDIPEDDGIRATKALLERIGRSLA